MDAADQSRRALALTIQRFAEMAWARHGPTRYASVGLAPMVVALFVPGWWWAMCVALTTVALLVDLRAHRFFDRVVPGINEFDEPGLQALVRREIMALALITALYAAPYVLLAFAPPPGPILGIVFCAGAAVVCATLHVMTRTMILFTIPAIALGLVLNAAMLAEGAMMYAAGALAVVVAVNAIVSARAGAASFGDLIAARLVAEQTAEDLERRVAERTAELAVATQRAQDANRAKSMFLANMSHELRTPLNAVIGYSEIVEEDLADGETEKCADDLGRIRRAANHLLAMITEVLDFSRIEAGKLELNPTEISIGELLQEAIDTVRVTADKQGTSCTLRVAPALRLLYADETRVRQCVLNLLSNAAKFTDEGAITVEARPCRIRGADAVAIAVRDTGPGIEEDQLTRLFQPFVQADASHTRRHDGAGLGLVITRRLARAMGGDVRAASVVGEGSVFTLYLPLGEAARAAA